ncbi:MAG TPA: protein kinase [Geodermatophilus sp.]|nr:protein kinase [Geodermatophilus sp.]
MEFREFGPYRIEGLIGRGGMGEVYRAFDTEHQRTVALKVLTENLAADRNYRERFRREAYAAARLSDPHIVPIHRYGEIDGRLFLDMRLVRGRDLAAVLAEEGPLSPARAVSVVSQVARALDAAHAEGLVHRDVKPSNVLVCTAASDEGDDEDEFVYLVDFGIARSVMSDGAPALTQAGSAVGSFDYMAPERFLERPADARCDVYSLACVLFELLTGRRPFLATDLAPLMWAHLHETPPAVSTLRPEVPAALDEVVAMGLAKDPDERWRSAGAMASAARRALSAAGMRLRADAAPPADTSPGPRSVAQPVGFSDPGRPMPEPASSAATAEAPPGPQWGTAPTASRSGPEPLPSRTGPEPSPSTGSIGATRFLASPPVPPPPGSRGIPEPTPPRRSWLPAALLGTAALLAVALIAVVLVAGTGGASAEPAPDPPGPGPRQDDLLAVLPADFDAADCRPAPAAGDGDVAAVDCGPSATQPGPRTSRFFLYPDGEAVGAAFAADVARLGLPELTGGATCPGSQGYLDWTLDGRVMGKLACYIDEQNTAVLVWTETEDAVEAVVRIRNGGTAGLTALMEWWNNAEVTTFGG